MPVIQPVVDLVDILVQQGLSHAVISPGSRSAAITLAFARNQAVKTLVSIDERSAGYIALGLATELGKPVAVVCTSGTAAYNLAPAVAEAFFSQVPLLVITADRPAEWIHQQDGQTIYQRDIYGRHVKASLELPTDDHHPDIIWHTNRIANEAYLVASRYPLGPVHLNVPIREPFYPLDQEAFIPRRNRIIRSLSAQPDLSLADWHTLQEEWEDAGKILIAGGQDPANPQLTEILGKITEEWEIPVLGDVTSNLGNHPDFISMQDIALLPDDADSLRPDLLVTFGESLLSKKFRNFIRKFPPKKHWHIGNGTHLTDSLQSLTLRIPVAPVHFFAKMLEDIDFKSFVENRALFDGAYKNEWLRRDWEAACVVSESIEENLTSLNDLSSIKILASLLEEADLVHLGNSMPVRYANILKRLGLRQEIRANRGTSGIDGCVSTAIGSALATDRKVFLIVGDVTFLYDRNGFLLEEFPSNLKILVLNNGGGHIFRMIDGPTRQPELGTYFETRHHFNAESTVREAGLRYFSVKEASHLEARIGEFVQHKGAALLEVFTDPDANKKVYSAIQEAYRKLRSN